MRKGLGFAVVAVLAAVLGGPVPASGASPMPSGVSAGGLARAVPEVIRLPDGFQPEGIAIGRGDTFYVGSLRDGAIYRGSVLTGAGQVLVPGAEGRMAAGVEVDRRNRLFVAGGATGAATVYDPATGARLAEYQLAPAGAGFVNDVVVTPRRGVLHRHEPAVPLRGAVGTGW